MRCPTCGFENPPGMRFCGHCGATLVVSRSTGEERRLVTILFADVVGSTRMLGTLDPEQVRAQMTTFFDIAREEIHRHGGTVDKFIGDAVMAVFGVPVTHEDDSERAVQAAAAIRTKLRARGKIGPLPEIRIGINTGEVVANTQTTSTGELLVTGEAVNLAARLQQHADPGQILVGERTMRVLRAAAQLRPVPPFMAKGVATPLPAWELVEVAPTPERQLGTTPFVNREEDLELLRGLLRRVRRESRGHVVTILGGAGIGKTRLVQEFRTRSGDIRLLRGRALPYGTGVPLWAVGEAIRGECGILHGDPLELAQRKLAEASSRLQVSDALPALLAVLGLGGNGHELPRETLFAGLRLFFQKIARAASVLIVLEDVHFADDATLDYIEHVAEWVRDAPLTLIVLARLELLERRPAWMGGKRSAMTLVLEPLAGEESRQMVLAMLGGKTGPDPLLDLVRERSEGNPLFIEEMLRALLERDVLTEERDRWTLKVPLARVAIPDGVHAVIAARLDALPAAERQALQNAAVMGKDFWIGSLRFVAGEEHEEEILQKLVAKEVLVQRHPSTWRDEEEFTFRHILIRDVAYNMLPKAQRWLKHARCAEWLQQMAGDRQPEFADFAAHHWLQVVSLRQDLGLPPDPQALELAVVNLLLAADRAATLYANATAIDHYTTALELAPPPPSRFRALLGRGEVLMLLGQQEKAREDFAALRVLARDAAEQKWEALALDRLGQSYRRQDQIALALEYLEPALALSRKVGDPSLTGHILNHIGFAYHSIAKTDESTRALQEARTLLEASGDIGGLAESLHGLGETATWLGRHRDCILWSEESLKFSERIGNRALAGENRYMIAVSRMLLGEYEAAKVEVERSVAELAEIGDVWNSSFALGAAARVAVARGEFGKAVEYSTQGLTLARQIKASRQAVLNLLMKGSVHRELEDIEGAWLIDQEAASLAQTGGVGAYVTPLVLFSLTLDTTALGRPDKAQKYSDQASQFLAERPNRPDYQLQLSYIKGRVLLALGKAPEAQNGALELIDIVKSTGTLHWHVPAMLLLADASNALGDPDHAATTYSAAAEEASRLGCLSYQWRALAGWAEVQSAGGHLDDASTSARNAQVIIARLAKDVADEQLRAIFLQSPMVQRVLAMAQM